MNEIAENSKITNNGKIVPKFSHLAKKLKQEKKVLILGSGYVVPPVIDFFSNVNSTQKDANIKVIVGTNEPEEAKKQFGESVQVIEIDVTKDKHLLNELIKESDIVIRYDALKNLHRYILKSDLVS